MAQAGEQHPPSAHPSEHEAEKEVRGEIGTGSERSSIEQANDTKEKDVEIGAPAARTVSEQAAIAAGKAHVNDMSSIPNGGLRAWMQVLGAFFLFFNSWGIINTWGIYQTYYELDILKGTSGSTIAWVGSIQAFLLVMVGSLTGPLYDAGFFRHLLIVGSFLVVFGHEMLSLCTKYYEVLLAQGICVGLGLGCLFVPSVAILSTYFTTRLATATGIAAAGSSLGGVIYPIVLNRLIPRIGFPWAVRIIGFIALGTLFVPNIVMKVRVLPPARRKLIDQSAFKHPAFLVFVFGAFFAFLGLFVPFFFMQSFAISRKVTDENLAFYLLSILNAASTFGRIVPNIIADKLGPFNTIIPCAIMTGILTLCLLAVRHAGGMIAFTVFFGFFSGSFVSIPPTVMVRLTPDRRFIGTRMGMCFAVVSVAVLVGSPIGGAIIKASGYNSVWIYGGVLVLVGASLMAFARVLHGGTGLMVKV